MIPTTGEAIQKSIIQSQSKSETSSNNDVLAKRWNTRRQIDYDQQYRNIYHSNVFPTDTGFFSTSTQSSRRDSLNPEKTQSISTNEKQLNAGVVKNKLYMSTIRQAPKDDTNCIKLDIVQNNNQDLSEKQVTQQLKKQGLHVVKIYLPKKQQEYIQPTGIVEVRYHQSMMDKDKIKNSLNKLGIQTQSPVLNHSLNSNREQNQWIQQQNLYQKIGFLSNRDIKKNKSVSTKKNEKEENYFQMHAKNKEKISSVSIHSQQSSKSNTFFY